MKDMDKGLYSKYVVTKADGTPLDGDCFVLRPDRDPAARCALKEYACQTQNGELAADIEAWLDRIGELDYTTREAAQMMDASDKAEIVALRSENERLGTRLTAAEKRQCCECANRTNDLNLYGVCQDCYFMRGHPDWKYGEYPREMTDVRNEQTRAALDAQKGAKHADVR